MMLSKLLRILSPLLLWSVAACAGSGILAHHEPPVDGRVDGLTSTTASSKLTYVILPGNRDVQALDLQFQEFKLQAERALHYRGFTPALDPEAADIIVFLAYGLGEPRVSYELLVPSPAPPSSQPPPAGPAAPAAQVQPIAYTEPPAAPPGAPPATSASSLPPGAQGSSALPPLRNLRYFRYVSLSAIDFAYFKATGELAEVWRTNVSSIGKSDDLRRIVPVMLAAAMRRIAVGTHGRIPIQITERHPKARYIRGEITASELRALEAQNPL